MQPLFRAAAIAALALPLAFAPADAQNYRGAWTLYGGGIWFSDLNDNGDFDLDDLNGDADTDVFDDIDALADLTLDPGWIAGTQLEYWFGNGRFGLRANGSYTERQFKLEDVRPTEVDVDFGDVNTWFFNGDILARIMSPGPTRVWAPYVALGAGVVHYNPAGDQTIVIPAANAVFGDFVLDDGVGDDGNAATEFAIDFGLGTDVFPGWTFGGLFGLFGGTGIGLRFEVIDHYAFDSPAERLFDIDDGDLVDADDDFDGVHNIRFTAGTMLTFGRLFEERVAVAPPPAPPAPPEPEEEMLSICVVDPTLPGRVGYVDAVYMPSTGDTLAVRNGDRVDFDVEYPDRPPLYAGEASWFIAGEPMTLMVADREMEFVSFGGSRIIQPEELTWIGNYRGTPVFAEAGEVAAIERELDDALRMDEDLEDVLEERMELRDAIADLDVVYVPVEVGCVFQPFRMVEEVRKVRG